MNEAKEYISLTTRIVNFWKNDLAQTKLHIKLFRIWRLKRVLRINYRIKTKLADWCRKQNAKIAKYENKQLTKFQKRHDRYIKKLKDLDGTL